MKAKCLSALWLAGLLIVQLLGVAPARAEAGAQAVLELSDGAAIPDANAAVFFLYEGEERMTLAQVRAAENRGAFARVTDQEPDFGYRDNGIWLRLMVRNDGAEAVSRYLMLLTNFMSEITVYKISDGGVDVLLDQDGASVFSSRPVEYHQMIAPFRMKAGESGEILIRYASHGDTVLPLKIVDELGLAKTTNRKLIVDFSFYGLMAMVIIVSLISGVFFSKQTFLAYAIYAFAVLMLLFQRDGYAFQFLWPNAPAWNDFSSLPLGAALPFFAAIFTRSYLRTRTLHPNIDKVLIAVVLLQVLVVASAWVVGAPQAKQLALVSVSIAILVFISIGIMAYRKYGNRTLFFLIGWLGLFAGTLTMTLIHWTDTDITRAQSLDIMRAAMVFETLMMGLAMVSQIVVLQRDRDRLNTERNAFYEANLRMHERFSRLEQNYEMAKSVARSHSEAVTDLTHDLRQPLFALRRAINSRGAGARDKAEIEQSFEYIEALVEGALQDAFHSEEAGRDDLAAGGVTAVREVFAAVAAMFEDDAKASGMTLKVVESSAILRCDPIPILRILSNFVSNAVRYAPGARVLIGARRRGAAVVLEVHDTGPGMEHATLQRVIERAVQGDAPDKAGFGVGLSIVGKMAEDHGLDWQLESVPGRGTIARLSVASGEEAERVRMVG